jgi:hypothetical protein
MFRSKRFLALAFGLFAMAALPSGANAVLFTYSYTGNPFSNGDFNGDQAGTNFISGEFTIDAASNANITAATSNALVVSASFSDGVRTLTLPGVTSSLFAFNTDAFGEIIVDSDLDIFLGNDPDTDFIEVSLSGSPVNGFDFPGEITQGPGFETNGFIEDSVGVFALVPNNVPEPGAFTLLGVGLLGLGMVRARRRL